MKKFLKYIFCIIILSLLFLILLLGNRRTVNAEVFEINNNEITFKDETENFWTITDTENVYFKNEKVKLTFNDKGTDFLEDDKIIKIKRED